MAVTSNQPVLGARPARWPKTSPPIPFYFSKQAATRDEEGDRGEKGGRV